METEVPDVTRRAVLQLLAAAGLWRHWPALAAADARRWLGGYRDADGEFGLAGVDGDGLIRARTPLPGRMHAAVAHPDGRRWVALARRPGSFAAVLDSQDGAVVSRFETAPGRHFQGHGAFSADGEWFYSTENDFEGERGVIGVRAVGEGHRRRLEWPSHGIGPHELLLAPDGRSLLVANGGILTHPATGRSKLNLPTMQPSLVRLDAGSGELLDALELEPALHTLSIRHIAATPDGAVVFGMQNQGAPDLEVPLVGVWRGGERVSFLAADRPLWRGYIGSVAVDPGAGLAAASAPRDGCVLFWRLADGAPAGVLALADGCGVAPGERAGAFLVSSGEGTLLRVVVDAAGVRVLSRVRLDLAWDNHLIAVNPLPAMARSAGR